jgi:hypothetical protein
MSAANIDELMKIFTAVLRVHEDDDAFQGNKDLQPSFQDQEDVFVRSALSASTRQASGIERRKEKQPQVLTRTNQNLNPTSLNGEGLN